MKCRQQNTLVLNISLAPHTQNAIIFDFKTQELSVMVKTLDLKMV